MPTGGTLRIVLSSLIFVFTGIVQTICIQAVLYSGGGDRSTFLLAIPNYLGIVSVYFFGSRCFRVLDQFGVWCSRGLDSNRVHLSVYAPAAPKAHLQLPFFARVFHRDRRKLFLLAFNELGGFLTGLTGLSIAGSGLYQVVFSGATVFTALLSTTFLRRRLSGFQWFSIAMITAGLMITAGQVAHITNDALAASIISGLLFVLVSCLFYSTNYVIAEYLLDQGSSSEVLDEEPGSLPPPSGLDLSLYVGGSCLIVFTVYVLAHTIPNWHGLVIDSIERHHGNKTRIIEHYIYLALASFLHAISHYDILATVGAVTIGVLNAVRAVSVFAASSALFCSEQASQCYTSRKGLSTAVVMTGAMCYSLASASFSVRAVRAAGFAKVTRGTRTEKSDKTEAGKRARRSRSTSIDLSGSAVTSVVQTIAIDVARNASVDSMPSTHGWALSSIIRKDNFASVSSDG